MKAVSPHSVSKNLQTSDTLPADYRNEYKSKIKLPEDTRVHIPLRIVTLSPVSNLYDHFDWGDLLPLRVVVQPLEGLDIPAPIARLIGERGLCRLRPAC